MSDKIESTLKKGIANFQFVGKAKVNDYTYKIDEQSASGWIYSNLNLGVDCGNGNTTYCEMMGGYSSVNDSVIYVRGKKTNDSGREVDDYTNQFTVAWEDRFDEDILETVGEGCFIRVGLEKDTSGKTFTKKFLSAYDAIEYIKEFLEDGTVVNVRGDLKYSLYQGKIQIKKEVTSIYLSKQDEVEKHGATFQQTILVDKDSVGKYDKDLGAFPIRAYVVDYVGKYGEKKQSIKQNVAFPIDFRFEVDEADIEKGGKLLNKMFKVRKDNVNEIAVEGDIVEGQAKANVTIDDLPDDIKELIELGAYTEEEAIAKCTVGNTRERKMVIKKPVIRMVGDGDDKTPTISRTDDKYKFNELVFLSQLIADEEEDEDDGKLPFDTEEDTTDEYSLDDLDALLSDD